MSFGVRTNLIRDGDGRETDWVALYLLLRAFIGTSTISDIIMGEAEVKEWSVGKLIVDGGDSVVLSDSSLLIPGSFINSLF